MRSLGVKVGVILLLVMLPVFLGVTLYNQYQESRNIKNMHLERARILAITGAAAIGKMFEDAVASGQLTMDQVFDTNYVEIPGSNPKRFKTAYDDWADKNIRQVTESFLKDETVVFAAPVDRNGYLPTHNLKYSKGAFNDPANRTKRIFDDPVGIKAARNSDTFLMQEYRRDTGEIMWDVSAPITVGGKQWGSFRIGYSMDRTYRQIAAARYRVLALSLAYSAVLVLLSVAVFRMVARPLKAISAEAAIMARGDLRGGEFTYRGRDEIGRLAVDFNRMRENLRGLVGSFKEKSLKLSSAAQQLTATAEQSSSSAVATAATISEIASAGNEVSAHMKKVMEQTAAAQEMAGEGKKKLVDMEGRIGRIAEISRSIAGDVDELAGKAKNISRMTSLITQIADQTNLLALNAAIEAARAGEAGKGFAVVADEVRKLAEQSSGAAKDIMAVTQLIEIGTEKVVQAVSSGEEEIGQGTKAVLEAGKIFEEIIGAVEELAVNVHGTVDRVGKVDEALQDIAAATQEQSAASQEVAASAEMLGKMAAEILEATDKFVV
ncbi:MAG: methyl-accepting chemotaxis protein [Peptococcaceae bacterium]|nr:methyl-accepting chemotaxis protein [Peptococcaceae bacterium]